MWKEIVFSTATLIIYGNEPVSYDEQAPIYLPNKKPTRMQKESNESFLRKRLSQANGKWWKAMPAKPVDFVRMMAFR